MMQNKFYIFEDQETNAENFIKRAENRFGNKFDYSDVNYVNNLTPVDIICDKHGVFKQRPKDHLEGKIGCPKCAREKTQQNIDLYKYKTDDKYDNIRNFIKKADNKFGDKFDYSKVVYVNNLTPVKIICDKHGVFKQRPKDHLEGKIGCPKCAREKTQQNIDAYKFKTKDEYDNMKKELSSVSFDNIYGNVEYPNRRYIGLTEIRYRWGDEGWKNYKDRLFTVDYDLETITPDDPNELPKHQLKAINAKMYNLELWDVLKDKLISRETEDVNYYIKRYDLDSINNNDLKLLKLLTNIVIEGYVGFSYSKYRLTIPPKFPKYTIQSREEQPFKF